MKEILKKRFGTFSFVPYVKKGLILLVIIYIPFAIAAFISDSKVKEEKYAAILLSAHAIWDYDYWSPPLAFLGSYPAWTFYFNKRNLKTDYIFAATADDFYRVLRDKKYQSMVVVGHGTLNSWRATDAFVTNTEVEALASEFEKKGGEWIQLSCAEKDFSPVPLGTLIVTDPKNVYFYKKGWAGTFDFVFDALSGFSHIKSM